VPASLVNLGHDPHSLKLHEAVQLPLSQQRQQQQHDDAYVCGFNVAFTF
jgi:hypothetical protein